MDTRNSPQGKNWYGEMGDRFDQLQKKYDFPEDISHEIREFVFGVAKEQYNTGNKSGIRWAFEQIRKEKQKAQTISLQPLAA